MGCIRDVLICDVYGMYGMYGCMGCLIWDGYGMYICIDCIRDGVLVYGMEC